MLSTSLMIRSLFFNTEIGLIKNNIALKDSLKENNSFSISFK